MELTLRESDGWVYCRYEATIFFLVSSVLVVVKKKANVTFELCFIFCSVFLLFKWIIFNLFSLIVFQRIAIAFLLAAMCEIWLKGDNKVNSGQSLLKRYHQQWWVPSLVTILSYKVYLNHLSHSGKLLITFLITMSCLGWVYHIIDKNWN